MIRTVIDQIADLDARLTEKCEWLTRYRARGLDLAELVLLAAIDRLLDARLAFMRDRDRT